MEEVTLLQGVWFSEKMGFEMGLMVRMGVKSQRVSWNSFENTALSKQCLIGGLRRDTLRVLTSLAELEHILST